MNEDSKKFGRLLSQGLITAKLLDEALSQAEVEGKYPEELLIGKGIPKHEILFCLSEHYGLPFIEFDEDVIVSSGITRRLDMEWQKKALWLPLSLGDNAEVIAYLPDSLAVIEDIKKTIGAERVRFIVALPSDIVRIIENNQDLNPGFPPSGGRTPLAKTRTFLANSRSAYTCYRTDMARGRTGLAMLRTGISFITIAVVLFRIFGPGYLAIADAVLLCGGVAMVVDGLLWYLPVRKIGSKGLDCRSPGQSGDNTVLYVSSQSETPVFGRSSPVEGAAELRKGWHDLTPVMRRRFLASDRTDLAGERTTLACFRTLMARARTGLAFTRTGVAFAGLGIAFLRQFAAGPWTAFDSFLIISGALMAFEGLNWYLPGRRAGKEGQAQVREAERKATVWDFAFPPEHKTPEPEEFFNSVLPVKGSHSPGIWGTTGLALERTMLADRRNVMARLRTVMARSRTGMSFVRTGMSVSSVGLGLLVYFGLGSPAWTAFDLVLIISGVLFTADGLLWHMPAENTRRQFPYCFADVEIAIPDYGRPVREWGKAVFSHDDI